VSFAVHKVTVRKSLAPRREPYWAAPIARGKFIGFRKIDDDSGTWIARMRDEAGRQQYRSLGIVTPAFDYDQAKEAAERWFELLETGVSAQVVTVADACRAYVTDRRSEKGDATARDAEARFERTIYKNAFGARPLDKIRAAHIKAWREHLGLKPATSNRTLIALKAALNLAVAQRQVSPSLAQEWRDVKPLKVAGGRRDLYLDLPQRQALIAASSGAVKNLILAAALTGARAGELVNATCSQFDARTKSMRFTGKTGTRTVGLSPAAVSLFKSLASGRPATDRILVRDDGKPWAHSDWDELVRGAAMAANLPAGVCLYTLRHSFITQAINSGMSTLVVARLVGTSVTMIERHYGHLVPAAARDQLAAVQMV